MRRWRWARALVGVVGLLSACGGDVDIGTGGGDPSSTGGATTSASPSTAAGAGGAGSTGVGGRSGCASDCGRITTGPCLRGVCEDGACVVVARPDGTSCEDELFCTTGDYCQAGKCQGGSANDCGMLAPTCQELVCDENTQSCLAVPLADSTPCSSSDLCIVDTVCQAGSCTRGTPKMCSDQPGGPPCMSVGCDAALGLCVLQPDFEGLPCIDTNDLCNVGATCAAGLCQGFVPNTCPSPGPCQVGVCEPSTGQCISSSAPDGSSCDDADPCTLGETCMQGTCGAGTTVTSCNGGDGCCPAGCSPIADTDCSPPP